MTEQRPRIGWIVDVQNDFMLPPEQGGRLYVHDLFDGGKDPGARQIVPALVRTVEWMREHCHALLYTGDWHAITDEEIDPVAPDAAKGTYPPHCMGLSADPAEREGAEIIAEVRPRDPVVVARDAAETDAREAARTALREGRPLFVQKLRFSVFEGNPATDALLDELADVIGAAPEYVVCGVARDVCVKGAVEGMLERGLAVTLVTDATRGLGLETEAESLARWTAAGLRTTRSAELSAARREAA
ncbi:MAG TPA: isochorismatase family protein [Longimicrobium sp.]|nr:isochorismatase family protein [Longimicrobium sp.]